MPVLFSTFSSVPATPLVRQLARWSPAPDQGLQQNLADCLGQWLGVRQAIALHTALAAAATVSATGVQPPPPPDAPALRDALLAELQRVRAVLTQSIGHRDPAHRPDPQNPGTSLALLHQRQSDQQRRMDMAVNALRDHVRQRLVRASPALAQLAALDAQMQALLAMREQRLLAGLSALLKARWAGLCHEVAAPDGPQYQQRLQAFEDDFEQLLLAELDLRLQPVMGLIEALET